MGRPTAQALDARAERRALIALVAMFALLLQALWPAAAMAAPTLGAGANWTPVPNVTPNGGQMQATVPLDGQARFFRLTSE